MGESAIRLPFPISRIVKTDLLRKMECRHWSKWREAITTVLALILPHLVLFQTYLGGVQHTLSTRIIFRVNTIREYTYSDVDLSTAAA